MKDSICKNIDLLYPTPVTLIGAMNGDKPTWTLVAHVGIIGHDKVLVSLAEPHFMTWANQSVGFLPYAGVQRL